jgi:DNA-nicking Smr family endonuclease
VSKGKRELSSEEKSLWRRVAAGVKPRRPRPTEREEDQAPSRPARAAKAPASPPSAPAPAPRRRAEPAPQDRAGEKRVRRGKLEIAATLDLHGHSQETGRDALGRFLRAAQARGAGAVVVVTGAGRGGEGVLKRRLPDWLAEKDLRPLVSGYAQAHRSHGGAGAFYRFVNPPRLRPL